MQDKFLRNFKSHNPAPRTIESTKYILGTVQKFIDKPLEAATWDDLLRYIERMQADGKKPNTIVLHKAKLKQFYLFCFDETDKSEYRKLAKRLSDKMERSNLSPLDILTPEEVKHVLNVASHEQERCIVASLFESGMRVGELLNLQIKDVQIDESKQEIVFHIPDLPGSKTGARPVTCLEIYNYVSDWLKCHPNPSPTSRFIEMETRWGIAQMLDRLFKRAGITKPNNPHILRHSAITHAVNIGMQETAIKERFWGNVGSAMLTTYVHLNQQMQSEAYRNAKGMNGDSTKVINPLALRCVNCGKLIQSGSLCKQCSDIQELSIQNKKANSENEDLKVKIAGLEERVAETAEIENTMNEFAGQNVEMDNEIDRLRKLMKKLMDRLPPEVVKDLKDGV